MQNKTSIILITLILSIIAMSSFAFAQEIDTGVHEDLEDLYQYESLTVDTTITGTFELNKESSNARASELSATLALLPYENFYQNIISQEFIQTPNTNTNQEMQEGQIVFTWNDPEFQTFSFEVQATVQTTEENHKLRRDVSFPVTLTDQEIQTHNLDEYLAITETIDWDNKEIQAKAIELSQGKDNLFEVTFALASWVEENVEYDLSTLNKETSQKASTVLRNKNGVCDEMTSLYIAMSRSLGIPTRFISGLTYTNSELFEEPWQLHGWAESYFPGHGWVAFDPTFGEYGYVDVTHIPMKESADPQEYSTLFRWLGQNIDFEDKGIEFDTTVTKRGNVRSEKYDIETQILSESVQFGSYNLITAYLEDNTGTYQAATLELFAPEEIEILTRYKQSKIIQNEGQTVINWLIKVDEELEENFIYTFPYVIRTDTGKLIESSFTAQKEGQSYSKEEAQEFMPTKTTLEALNAIDVSCEYEKVIQTSTDNELNCQITNIKNEMINSLNVCHYENCQELTINPGDTKSFKSTINIQNPGWKTQIVTFKNKEISYSAVLPLQVLDSPKVLVLMQTPEEINYGEEFQITITATQESFAAAQNLNLDLNLGTANYNWQIDEFAGEETIILEGTSEGLAKQNTLVLEYSWEDEMQNIYQDTTQTDIIVNPTSTQDTLKILINKLSIWLTSF